jgi:hypothetical protein
MKRVLVATAALLCIAAPAMAQNVGSASSATVSNSSQSGSSANVVGNPIGNGASSSISGANSGSRSRSNSSATSGYAYSGVGNTSARTGSSSAAITINNGTSAAGDPPGDPSGSAGGDPTINYSGSYTVRNVPEVIAPSIVGGNPCTVGISGGVGVSGFGFTAGGTWADRQCERRQEAALLYNIGQHDASVALLCQDDSVRAAINSTGQACPGQPRVAAQASAPAVVASRPVGVPTQVAAVAVAAPVAPAVVAPKPAARPDWCDTVDGPSEQARFVGQCHWYRVIADQTPVKAQRHPVGKQFSQAN